MNQLAPCIISSIAIIFSYQMSTEFVNIYAKELVICSKILLTVEIASYYLTQLLLGIAFSATSTSGFLPLEMVLIIFFIPTWACQLPIPLPVTKLTPLLTAVTCALLSGYRTWENHNVYETPHKKIVWYYNVIYNYCLYTVIENIKIKLHIPHIFQGFWIIDFFMYLLQCQYSCNSSSLSLHEILQGYITHRSGSIIALLGMACAIGLLCQLVGYSMQAFLQIKNPSEKNIGNISVSLFLILSLQSGITGLEPEKRFYKFIHILLLLCTVLLHFIHNMLQMQVLSLNISRSTSFNKHARSFITGIILITIPIIILVHQWKSKDKSTWLLTITCLMIELLIKTMVSVVIYILYVIDVYKNGLWENLDNYIYYLEVAASFTEFVVGINLMFNGLRIFIFESSNILRACMLGLHVYFNIWVQITKIWESHLLCQSAKQDLSFLQDATKEQLKNKKDICPICFQELITAKVTTCNHFFHKVCLRKWLKEQNTCPLCYTVLYRNSIQP
ncbi:protein TRC8 homolog [Stegodyphus dumicola]|uniref:protein TRC8 homolog n=1 Tax=Stegodyphus dumicola TaxID=202533 RepID=UPI0015AC10B1|nr:protein TRC8 homolog [Stegodyphus dumicola]